jgi:hypothetical protein
MTDGLIDPTSGKHEENTLNNWKDRLSVKYEKHIRFLLGTAAVFLPEGTLEGRRAASEEYTDIRNHPKDGVIFGEDDVCKLAGIGDKTTKKLKHFGLFTMLVHVTWLLDADIEPLAKMKGLSFGLFETAHEQARTAAAGKYKGVVIDHKKSKTPYELLHGDCCMEVIDASPAVRTWTNIHNLRMHMAVETDEVMKGIMFEGKVLFKRNTLFLMTAP